MFQQILNVAILLFPNWLCFDWAMACLTKLIFFDKRIFILVAFWSILSLMAVKILFNLKARKLEYFALCLLITPFVLSMNVFVYVGFVIAERNLYLSQAGMSLIISKGFLKLNILFKSKHKKMFSDLVILYFFKKIRQITSNSEKKSYFCNIIEEMSTKSNVSPIDN